MISGNNANFGYRIKTLPAPECKISKIIRTFALWLIIWLAKFKYLVCKYWSDQFILVFV